MADIQKITERAVAGQKAKSTFINDVVDKINELVDEANEATVPAGMTDAERAQLEANTTLLNSISSSFVSNPMTQAQYDALTSRKAALYFIVDELGRLQKIYYKSTLIAKRGETPNNISFPYTFPIVFS